MKSLRGEQHKTFVAELKRIRSEAGFTQAALAEKLGVPQSFVAKVEGLERRLDVVEFVNWMEALNQSSEISIICDRVLTAHHRQ
ncbi:helix-turn-helix domain-containing protein [Parasphingorhabdus sp.]|uniref:helix-turn-helix domain-containing protein n=1 Tax=Parasphingorhabdus sp. TaxID=2709688 RepID=UPI0032ECC904